MITAGEVYDFINSFAPFDTAMKFDNPGLLVGDRNAPVEKVLLSLDITPAVAREAARWGAQAIVSHHPVIFEPLRSLQTDSVPYLLANNGIAAICAHTNLDMAVGGVNTCLARRLGLQNVRMLKEYETSGLPEGLVGELEKELTSLAFAEQVKRSLGCDGLRFVDGKRPVRTVGLCSGGGADLLYDAAAYGAQAFVTGESKHNQLLDAENLGLTLVDAGHFYSEDVVIEPLCEMLAAAFPQAVFAVSRAMHSPARFL